MEYLRTFFSINFFLVCISLVMYVIAIRRYKQHKQTSIYIISIISIIIVLAVIELLQIYTKDHLDIMATTVLAYFGYVLRPVCLILFIFLSGQKFKKRWVYVLIFAPLVINALIYVMAFIPETKQYLYSFSIVDGTVIFSGGYVRYSSHIVSLIFLIYLMYISVNKLMAKHIGQAVDLFICAIVVVLAVLAESFLNTNGDIYILNTSIAISVMTYYMFLYSENLSRDALTGLFNRAVYFSDLVKMERTITGLIQLDMNGLKYINDNYGHLKGDEALQNIGKTIIKFCNRNMYAYRIGGDEFVVLAVSTSQEKLFEIASNIRDAFKESEFSCAIGVAYKENKNMTVDELFKTAEQNMYNDKEEFYKSSKYERRRG